MKIPVVFMGSPEFSIPSLRKLTENYPVVGVVTQPDKPSGRGKSLTPPAVKKEAERLGLPFIQPDRLRDPDTLEVLKKWAPGLIIVSAYGQILHQDILNLPAYGCINVHASLLPRWRGAAPIQAAILAGDDLTGVTIMKMDVGLDNGPILAQRDLKISDSDTAGSLSVTLAQLGAELLIETLPDYLSGRIVARKQDESLVTKAPLLTKQDGNLDFNQEAYHLARQVRAYNPWPGCYTKVGEQVIKIHKAHATPVEESAVGNRRIIDGKPAFDTKIGILVIDELQPAGKRIMSGEEFLRGNRNWANQ